MTDAHFHRNGFDTFLVTNGHEVAFHGLHPWQSAACADIPAALAIAVVVVFSYPFSKKSFTAELSILLSLAIPLACIPFGMMFRSFLF